MDRHPFLTASKAYLNDVRAFYRESTLQQSWRDFQVIDKDLEVLRKLGSVGTTAPVRLTERDVTALLARWQTRPSRYGRPMDATSQAHLLKVLANLLGWCGNPVIDAMRKRRHVRFPRELRKPIRHLTEDELNRLAAAAQAVDGWNGSVARFLVAFLPATGLRPKEVRMARLEDLDMTNGVISVAHPKGEGSWAAAGVLAPVLPGAEQAVRDFLMERQAFLNGEDHPALIPYRRWDGTLCHWTDAMMRKLKGDLQRLSGVQFSLKTFRATFAQMAKDRGARIEAVSKALRHASTKTTEEYYARIKDADAFSELKKVFVSQPLALPKSPEP